MIRALVAVFVLGMINVTAVAAGEKEAVIDLEKLRRHLVHSTDDETQNILPTYPEQYGVLIDQIIEYLKRNAKSDERSRNLVVLIDYDGMSARKLAEKFVSFFGKSSSLKINAPTLETKWYPSSAWDGIKRINELVAGKSPYTLKKIRNSRSGLLWLNDFDCSVWTQLTFVEGNRFSPSSLAMDYSIDLSGWIVLATLSRAGYEMGINESDADELQAYEKVLCHRRSDPYNPLPDYDDEKRFQSYVHPQVWGRIKQESLFVLPQKHALPERLEHLRSSQREKE